MNRIIKGLTKPWNICKILVYISSIVFFVCAFKAPLVELNFTFNIKREVYMLSILKFFWEQKTYFYWFCALFCELVIPIVLYVVLGLYPFLDQSWEENLSYSSGKEEDQNSPVLAAIVSYILSVPCAGWLLKEELRRYFLKLAVADKLGAGVLLVDHKLGAGVYYFVISFILLFVLYIIISPANPQEKQV